MKEVLGLLWPSFLVHWACFITIVCVVWFVLSKMNPSFKFNFKSAFVVATGFWLCLVTNSLVNYYQSGVLNTAAAVTRAQQQAQNSPEANIALKMKQDFLADVDAFAQNPEKLTPELKQKLWTVYGPLFPKGEADKKEAFNAINTVYQCQRYFWEDAMSSYKAKVAIKSDSRKECEKLSGAFFNREKLLTDEVIKRNDELIKAISERKRVPASDGKEIEFTETNIRQSFDSQVKSAENLQKIFN